MKNMKNTRTKSSSTKKIGIAMLLISWILGIVLIWILYQKIVFTSKPFEIITTEKYTKIKIYPDLDEHFKIDALVNNNKVIFLIDTGASYVAISDSLANKFKLKKLNTIMVNTASGETIAYKTIIDSLVIGPVTFKNVAATIMPHMHADYALLGMNVLKHFKIEQTKNHLILTFNN